MQSNEEEAFHRAFILKPAGGYCNAQTPSSTSHCLALMVSVLKRHEGSSVGFSSFDIRPQQYEQLLNRGWRRSGTFYYRPDNLNTCCPQYPIRTIAANFHPAKSQRKALNKWNKFILGQNYKDAMARLRPVSRREKLHRRQHPKMFETVQASLHSFLEQPYDSHQRRIAKPDHRFEVTVDSDDFTEEKFNLFREYQMSIHHEDSSQVTRSAFKRFLCSGFKPFTWPNANITGQHGSIHQCYRLDGQLVACGVLDVLPAGLSSVYLMHKPDLREWSFGKISALHELSLCLEMQRPAYYLGFYIHNCPKMRYKAEFKPAELLDPVSNQWTTFDEDLQRRLSARKFVSRYVDSQIGIGLPDQVFDHNSPLKNDMPLQFGNLTIHDLDRYLQIPATSSNSYGRSQNQTNTSRYSNVFEASTPGVLSLKEVESLASLKAWRLILGQAVIRFQDLSRINPDYFAELDFLIILVKQFGACIGPDLMAESILDLGDL